MTVHDAHGRPIKPGQRVRVAHAFEGTVAYVDEELREICFERSGDEGTARVYGLEDVVAWINE